MLYDFEEVEVRELGVDVPRWIDQDIHCGQVAAIMQGGCASGAYMPAVTYYTARQIMAEHGDDVLDFLAQWNDMDRFTLERQSWDGLACAVLAAAVEAWADIVGEGEVIERLEEVEEWAEDNGLTHLEAFDRFRAWAVAMDAEGAA